MWRARASRRRFVMVRYTEPRRERWVSISGGKQMGQKVTTRRKLGRYTRPSHGIQEIVAKHMKIIGLSAICVWANVCKRLKGDEMLRGVREEAGKRRWRGGYSS